MTFGNLHTNLLALLALSVPLSIAASGCTAPPDEPSTAPAPSAAAAESPEATPAIATRPARVFEWHGSGGRDRAHESHNAAAQSAGTTASLVYYGGHVISNVQVVQVLYGGSASTYMPQIWSTASPSMASFYGGVTSSPWFSWLNEYDTNIVDQAGQQGTNQLIGPGSFLAQVQITPSSTHNRSTISDANIQAELAAQIAAGHLPTATTDSAGNPNTIYMVNFPRGKRITLGTSASCVAGGFCAYHGTGLLATGQEFYYGVLPDMESGSGCDVGCGADPSLFNDQTSVASHELAESVTDAEVGLAPYLAPPLAWYDNVNGEIGDICNADQGTTVGGDGVTYVVQKLWSNAVGACIASKAAPPPPGDFSIVAEQTSLSVTDGTSAADTVDTTITTGASETVSFSASGAPSGVTVSFSPSSVSSGASTVATVNATAAAAAGTYTVTLTGTAASGSHSTAVSLTVVALPPPPNDFSIGLSASSLTVTDGTQATDTVQTAVTSGSAETVTLTASGAPAGVTVSLSPASIASGTSSAVTVTAATTVAPGSYPITITGTSGSTSHSATLGLTIDPASTSAIVNGDFEMGTLAGWTSKGTTAVTTSGPHSGTYAAMLGALTPTNGDSSISQTFKVPVGNSHLTFWYDNVCDDTVRYDWATATLKDNTTGKTTTLLPRTCNTTSSWKSVTATVTAGHSYTLTLVNHDDNYPGDPTYTLYDDVTLQ
jgi:hypothetical protein